MSRAITRVTRLALAAAAAAAAVALAAPAPSAFEWPEDRRAALSLTFDDARETQVDAGVALLDRHGVRATFYVSPDRVRGRLAQWKAVAASAHEIGNHSTSHPCSGNFAFSRGNALEDYDLARLERDVADASLFISRELGREPASFAYPCGQAFVGRGEHVRSYVPYVARAFRSGRMYMGEAANDPAYADLAQLMAVNLDGVSFESLRPLLQQTIEQGGWLILAGHEMGGDKPQTSRTDTLEALCRFAKDPANGIWVDTVGAIAAHVAQARERVSPAAASDARVEDLLRRMTLEEKVGQMNMPCVYEGGLGRSVAEKQAGVRAFATGAHLQGLGPGGGFFTLPNTILHDGTRQQVEFVNELQRLAVEKTRLGIPLLMTEEGTHGLMASGGTIFPEGPALGSTWNLDLVSRVYRATAAEGRAIGMHQLFTLVVEPIRDPRLGRNQEAYSEDPWLVARIAETIVRAVQGEDVSAPDRAVAGLCHYPGQSQPHSGLERGPMEVSERKLREIFLPPWEAGIRDAGALGVMATYPAIDGQPAHGSAFLLGDVLRDELRFEGLVLSEGGGIGTLVYEGVARDMKEAGQQALRAGVDVGISYESGYMLDLVASVREGLVPEALVDRAVRRILRQKQRLGLFERHQVDVEHALRTVHCPAHQQLALEAAREGIVLLKNEGGLLPLDRARARHIAVIGPNADDAKNQLGDYTAKVVLQDVVTVLDGIRAAAPQARVTHVRGCDVLGDRLDEIDAARRAAADADVAVVVVGENEWQARAGDKAVGTSGEGRDVATLELTGRQEELVRAVSASGTPTVVVLVNGRPLATRWIAANVPAIVEAWNPGEKGGQAVAEVLFGDVEPSGRLPVTIPRHVGQLPVHYDQPKSKDYWLREGWGSRYADLDPTPLFPFGHGLGYTRFEMSGLRLSAPEIASDGTLEVRVDVRNVGSRPGTETVQLYVQDVVSSVSTPLLQLRGFRRVRLAPGESQAVAIPLRAADLALLDSRLRRVVEPGEFKVMVGASAADIRLTGSFRVRDGR